VIAQQILRKLFPSRLRLALTPEGLLLSGRVMVTQLLGGAECVVSVVPPGCPARAHMVDIGETIAA